MEGKKEEIQSDIVRGGLTQLTPLGCQSHHAEGQATWAKKAAPCKRSFIRCWELPFE